MATDTPQPIADLAALLTQPQQWRYLLAYGDGDAWEAGGIVVGRQVDPESGAILWTVEHD